MKILKCLIIFILFIPNITKADVIYSPLLDFGVCLSFELIGSYEFPLTKYNTINTWAGIGAVSSLSKIQNPALGTELAIELRQYFKKEKFQNFNIGLYAGFAYMRIPYFYGFHVSEYDNSFGFVPGLKVTYKKRINSWLIGEPYVSISTPWYNNNFGQLFNWISHSDPGLIFTIGLRIGFNKVWIKDKKITLPNTVQAPLPGEGRK